MAEWIDVISGVPQGSVLEPLLFLIFVQDLPDCIGLRTTSKLFADDTKIWTKFCQSWRCKFPPAGSILQWSAKWPLEFNPLKCKVMKIGHKSYLPTRCTMLLTHITCVDTVWNCSCPCRCSTITVRKTFFSTRVVSYWNALSQHVMEAPSVNSFKNRLDKQWSDMGI